MPNSLTTTKGQLLPVPTDSMDPDVPGDMYAFAAAVEKRVMAVYASTTDRDAKTTGGGGMGIEEGMFAFVKDTNTVYFYTGSAWQVFPVVPAFTVGTTVPSNTVGVNGDVFYKL